METLFPVYLILLSIITYFIVRQYWVRILFALSLLWYLPVIVELGVLWNSLKLVHKVNGYYLKQGRFTIWAARSARLKLRCYSLLDDLTESIKRFVFGNLVEEVEKMITIQRVGNKIPYVPQSQRDLPEDKQATFYFKKIKRRQIAETKDRLFGLSEKGRVDELRNSSVSYEVTLLQLCDWKGIVDENGSEVTFDVESKEDLYDMLPIQLQDELEAEFGSGVQEREKDAVEAEADAGTDVAAAE